MSSGVCEQKNPLNYPITTPCVLDKDGNILKGVCSEETEEMLKREDCQYSFIRQRYFITATFLEYLIPNMCTFETTNTILGNGTRNNIITTRIPPYLIVVYLPGGIITSYTPYGKQEIDFMIYFEFAHVICKLYFTFYLIYAISCLFLAN